MLMSTNSKKRRASSVGAAENPEKRPKLAQANLPSSHAPHPSNQASSTSSSNASSKAEVGTTSPASEPQVTRDHRKNNSPGASESPQKRIKINKLVAPKPFPTVAASASATGPRSAHKEGKNYICLTRKTPLGAYMRRCKSLIIDNGYKTLHLHAAGAAIPLLLQLTCALPPILPFPRDEIHTDISTGTVEVQDEIIPEDEEEDLTYRTRGKSTLYVIFRIGSGQAEGANSKVVNVSQLRPLQSRPPPKTKKSTINEGILVYEEPEQEPEDI